jgi:hypothetical protein
LFALSGINCAEHRQALGGARWQTSH